MNKFSLLILLSILVTVSCGKKSEDSPKPQIKLLIKVVKKFSGRIDSTETLYQYDERNRLKTIILISGYARVFSYEGDKLLNIEDVSAGTGTWRFNYENNEISRGVFNSRNSPTVNYNFQYHF